MRPSLFPTAPLDEYALLDSGRGEKLERFGPVVLRRPDPQALWRPELDPEAWSAADLVFVRESDRGGRWEAARKAPPEARAGEWTVAAAGGRFVVRPTPFKHLGIFPEQATNWAHVERLAGAFGAERPRLLNLFGYTGVASVLAARAGYDVTHVDASRSAIAWTRENMAASGLAPDALRVLLEDATAFARREQRRKARYHVVLLDPPHHGRGPKGETWQFEDDVAALLATVRELLHERAAVCLSTYAIGCTPLALEHLVAELGAGTTEAGELVLGAPPRRLLPAGLCARWRRGVEPRTR
jgi:23S rRNA (cytosine1962-C5)-methyltransferase